MLDILMHFKKTSVKKPFFWRLVAMDREVSYNVLLQ